MARNLTAEELRRIVYSKFLLQRATLLGEQGHDMALVSALLTAHDAVEMLMRVVSDVLNVRWESFLDFWQKIQDKGFSRPPRYGSMDQLNSERAGFKHKGIIPNPANLRAHLLEATSFCEEAARAYLNLDFQAVSLADLIQNSEARVELKSAEQAANTGNFGAAVTACGNAFDILFEEARAKHGQALVGDIPVDTRAFIKSLASESLKRKLQKVAETVDALILGISPPRLRQFSEITPIRQRSGSGEVTIIWTRDPVTVNQSEFQFCHSFVIDAGLQLAV
jgi:hypothetical protein